MGATELKDGVAVYQGPFPIGSGIVLVKKNGYLDWYQAIQTDKNEKEATAELEQFVDVNISLLKVPIRKFSMTNIDTEYWAPVGGMDLDEYDDAIITLERIARGRTPHSTFAGIDSDAPSETVRLLPGKYKVDITIFSDYPIFIPEDEYCYSTCPIFCGEECEDVPEIKMDGYSGGAVLDANSRYFEITAEELNAADEIMFYGFSYNPVDFTKHDDLKKLGNREGYTYTYRNMVEPEIT